MKLRIHGERTSRLRSTQIVFGDIILQRAQQDVHHRLGDRNQLQRAVSLSLASQRSPSLKRPEHRANSRRGNLTNLGAEGGIERVVLLHVAGKDVAIYSAK